MGRKKPLTTRGVEHLSERERTVGIEPDDEAARWLGENDPPPPPRASKSAKKSVTLHRFKRR